MKQPVFLQGPLRDNVFRPQESPPTDLEDLFVKQAVSDVFIQEPCFFHAFPPFSSWLDGAHRRSKPKEDPSLGEFSSSGVGAMNYGKPDSEGSTKAAGSEISPLPHVELCSTFSFGLVSHVPTSWQVSSLSQTSSAACSFLLYDVERGLPVFFRI